MIDIPGSYELPLAVQISAVGKAPAIEAVHAGIDATHNQRSVLQAGLVAGRTCILVAPTERHGAEFGKEKRFVPGMSPAGPARHPPLSLSEVVAAVHGVHDCVIGVQVVSTDITIEIHFGRIEVG